MAWSNDQFIGYVTLKWTSDYPFLREKNIPEICDLNVLPNYRNNGIGTKLLETAEMEASKKSKIVGIGVGLLEDYGSAQRLYVKRGYIPNGKGITYQNKIINYGENVVVDDDLVLWFEKRL